MNDLDAWLREGPATWPERMWAQSELARMVVEDVDQLGRYEIDDDHRFVKCCYMLRDGLVVIATFARDNPRHAHTTWARHPDHVRRRA